MYYFGRWSKTVFLFLQQSGRFAKNDFDVFSLLFRILYTPSRQAFASKLQTMGEKIEKNAIVRDIEIGFGTIIIHITRKLKNSDILRV